MGDDDSTYVGDALKRSTARMLVNNGPLAAKELMSIYRRQVLKR